MEVNFWPWKMLPVVSVLRLEPVAEAMVLVCANVSNEVLITGGKYSAELISGGEILCRGRKELAPSRD
jgi:hypothetical protein